MADDARAANWTLHPVAHFASVARTWDALCAQSGALPFLRSDFLLPALAEFGTGREVMAVAGGPGEPVAMGLFVRKRAGTWETFQPAQLPLGALVAGNTPDVTSLARSLMPALPGFALSVALTQQDPAIRARPREAATLGTLDYVDTARVAVEGTFEAYWSARGKNLRQNVRKQLAKVEQDGILPRFVASRSRKAWPRRSRSMAGSKAPDGRRRAGPPSAPATRRDASIAACSKRFARAAPGESIATGSAIASLRWTSVWWTDRCSSC
jgi:CelD/BcsL family acetyltransferase involved in cellulose biosynthesis